MQLTTAMNMFMGNKDVWFTDNDGTIRCGHITNICGVKDSPNAYVARIDHIKTDPATNTMVCRTESKQLCDLYKTKSDAENGYI